MDAGLVLGVAVLTDVIIAIAYAIAGRALLRRRHEPGARRAAGMFALWWFGITATALASGTICVLVYFGAPAPLVDAFDQISLAVYATALVGFCSYLGFIFFGSHVADRVLIPVYSALTLWSVTSAIMNPATAYRVEAWRAFMVRAPGPAPPEWLVAILLVLPLVGGTLAYASLYFRAAEREARFRVALVSSALIAWITGALIISLRPVADTTAAQLGGRTLVVVAACAMALAFQPPLRVRAWMGDVDAALDHRRIMAALDGRAHDLI